MSFYYNLFQCRSKCILVDYTRRRLKIIKRTSTCFLKKCFRSKKNQRSIVTLPISLSLFLSSSSFLIVCHESFQIHGSQITTDIIVQGSNTRYIRLMSRAHVTPPRSLRSSRSKNFSIFIADKLLRTCCKSIEFLI